MNFLKAVANYIEAWGCNLVYNQRLSKDLNWRIQSSILNQVAKKLSNLYTFFAVSCYVHWFYTLELKLQLTAFGKRMVLQTSFWNPGNLCSYCINPVNDQFFELSFVQNFAFRRKGIAKKLFLGSDVSRSVLDTTFCYCLKNIPLQYSLLTFQEQNHHQTAMVYLLNMEYIVCMKGETIGMSLCSNHSPLLIHNQVSG